MRLADTARAPRPTIARLLTLARVMSRLFPVLCHAVAAAMALGLLAPPAAAQPRTKIGLVLGGGGARGAAHIGVLEVLEQLRVPVDCVAGTSFGALVAGAWAAGVTPAQMRQAMAQANWTDMFQDNPDFNELNYRHKRLSQRFLPGSEAGLDRDGVTYPPGAVAGQKVKLFINQLVRADSGEPQIDRLPLTLSIVATDIGSGERVVFRDGSLTQAMRASMSVPGLMAPLELGGRKLVDGGLVDNLPVREVRERCGADVVIAVNVGSPLLAPEQVGSLLSVSAQMVALLTEQNVTQSLQRLQPGDIYIKPVLGNLNAGQFERFAEAADSGRTAAQWSADALRRLAVDEASWQSWQAVRQGLPRTAPHVDAVDIAGLTLAQPEVVTRYITQRAGEPLDTAQLNRDLLRVFGDGWYESVDYSLVTVRDRQRLRITPVEKSWGPDYLRFAINLDSTLSQGSSYSLRAAYQKTWLNRLGGELLASVEIGSRTALELEFHQPLDARQRFFTELELGSGWTHSDLFQDGRRIARFQVYRSSLEATAGISLSLLGQLRAGWHESVARADIETGLDLLPRASQYFGGPVLSLDLDKLDRLYFPTSGWAAQLRYLHSRRNDYSKLSADLRAATALGPWVLGSRLMFTGSTRGQLPALEAGTLGGFLNLSGYASGQFIADTVRYGHVRAERIIGRLPAGLRGDMRLGMALELGRVSGPYTETSRTGLLDSVTLYLGGETPFGPVYLGFGHASSGSSNAYLFLGTP